ncbi:MAG TPA: XrtA/PEP-CTERM system amidotransferase, partial [Steroidobacteraceae bacterium]|nr:XrtA/PEP-CTERM system amidotransferase [Steroidobacteraceae bacterium]
AALRRMNDVQAHRGPDGEGEHIEPGVALGHRRLSIIDVATGQQPLYNEDRSVVVVFNGEIYNYQSLIPELQALGHVFRTRSDTEVIVHAWESWGEQCVTRFRGMFAFALWDQRKETLFLARDRLGVKPLYYSFLQDGHVVFGSELKSLRAHGGLQLRLDPYATLDYLTLGYIPEPRSIYAGTHKLAAGHTLTLRRGAQSAESVRYWDPRFTLDAKISVEEATEELTAQLRESVKLRMIAEVPLGAFLSGGVDSSAVVATMAEVSSEPVNTCTMGFDDPAFDESQYALQVAQRYGTKHHWEQVVSDDFDLLDTLAGIYDEPFADSSAMPTYRVCALARKNVTVALSGDGGDEVFGGYRRYLTHLREQKLRDSIPQWLRGSVIAGMSRIYPSMPGAPRALRMRPMLEALARDPVAAYLHEVSALRGPLLQKLLTPKYRRELGGYTTLDVFRRHAANAQTDDPLALIQYLDMKTYLVDDINTKVDRASMAHSLEVREPLMDHQLIEWMGRLPSSLKVRDGQGKYLLKRNMRTKLPVEATDRRKAGFAVPLAQWFRGPLRSRVEKLPVSGLLMDSGYFDSNGIRWIVSDHIDGRQDFSVAIWSLLMFEAFLQCSHP